MNTAADWNHDTALRYGTGMRFRHRAFSLFLLTITACAASERARSDAPPAPSPPESSGLHVSLVWNAPVDLDLYLTDPSWETLYFANNPTRSGSRLETDRRCATLGEPSMEWARATDPAVGPYRIGVDFIDPCDTSRETARYRISVDLDGQHLEKTGTARIEKFLPKAFEFELRRSADGSLHLPTREEW